MLDTEDWPWRKWCNTSATRRPSRWQRWTKPISKNGHNTPWDATSDINIYWKYLDELTKKLEDRDIATSGNEKVSISVTQIWESGYFIEESLLKWGKKVAGNKAWPTSKYTLANCTKIAHSSHAPRQASEPISNMPITSKKNMTGKKRNKTTRRWCFPSWSSNTKSS